MAGGITGIDPMHSESARLGNIKQAISIVHLLRPQTVEGNRTATSLHGSQEPHLVQATPWQRVSLTPGLAFKTPLSSLLFLPLVNTNQIRQFAITN